MIGFALAAAIEVFASAGPAQWSECGTNGCWRQPPLQYQFQLNTHASQIGVRAYDFELAYHNLGDASVSGAYVADSQYDPDKRAIKPGTSKRDIFLINAREHTTGVTLQYAPRFSRGAFSVQPSVGVLRFHQSEVVVINQPAALCPPPETVVHVGGSGWTPVVGLRALYALTPHLSAGAGMEFYLRPRLVNSVAGGGSDHPVGLRTQFLEVRYAF